MHLEMDLLTNIFFAVIFALMGFIEIKSGKGILRRQVTKENNPAWFWLEVSVSFFLTTIFLTRAL